MKDNDADRALRDNLRVPALSPEALQRIRQATEAEWRANLEQTPSRHRWPAVAAVASLALLASSWVLFVRDAGPTQGEPMARLERTSAPGVVELRPLWRDAVLAVGSEIRAGQRLHVRAGSLLTLRSGGNLRVLPGTQLEVISTSSVRLERGEIYVDIPPGDHPQTDFVAITDAGEFRHIGTQFALSVIDGATRLRVREGSVRWDAPRGPATVEAGDEVVIDRDQRVTHRTIETSGAAWSWIETMAPAMEIEGRPLDEFLKWVARETGRKLVIQDEATRGQIAVIRMHGDVRGLEPLQALQAVIASTSLHCDLSAGAIRVSLASEPPMPLR